MANIIQALDFTWLLVSLVALLFVIHSIRLSVLSHYDEKLLELRIRLLKMRNREEIDATTYRDAFEKLMEMHPGEVIGNRAKIYSGVVWALSVFLSTRSSDDEISSVEEENEPLEDVNVWPAELQELVNEGGMAKVIAFLIMVPIPTLLLFVWLASVMLRAYARHRPFNVTHVWRAMSRILQGDPLPQH